MPTLYHCFMVLFPKTNGKAERFIQTLSRAWPYARIYITSNEWMAVLPIFLTRYNEHRNHGSFGNKLSVNRMPGVNIVAEILS